jgi:phospholipid transport system substrate-binding protein
MRNFIRAFSVLACSLLFVASVDAAAASKGDKGAASYIEDLGNQVLHTISNQSIAKDKKQSIIEGMFKANLDFDWVAKFVTSRFWRQATGDQKKRFVDTYRNFLTKHYTSRFSEYTSGSFKISGARDLGEGASVVSMEIASGNAGGQPIMIDYKVRKVNSGYKVFDIIVEGVSLITTQRSEFAAVLNKSGMDGLIEQLAAK